MKILYIAPMDVRRSGITRYAWAFKTAMKNFGKFHIDTIFDVCQNIIPFYNMTNIRTMHRNAQFLIKSGLIEQYDCIHTELGSDLYPEFFLTYYITQATRIPFVLTLHDAPFTVKNLCPYWDLGRYRSLSARVIRRIWNISIGRIYEKSLLRRSALVLTLTHRAFNAVNSRFPNLNTSFLPHISLDEEVPQRSYHWQGERQLQILFFGFIHPAKGVHLLLEAVAKLATMPQYRDRLKVNICGGFNISNLKSSYLQRLRRYVSEKKLESIVVFNGFIPDNEINRFFMQSDIIVLPYLSSRIISASGPLIRGMTFGNVPIVTNVRGFADEVVNGQDGFVVPPNNVQAIIEKLRYFLEHPKIVADMSVKAQEHVRGEHSWEVIALKMNSLYKLIKIG